MKTERLGKLTFWEKAATTKWGVYISEIEKRVILQAQSLAGKPGQALEMGCEGGRWSKLLSDLGWQMVCVDINQAVLSACQQNVPDAKCILAAPNDETIPCDSNSMNLLLCIEVPPVIQGDWFLREAARVLRDGGILAGVVWNRTSARALVHARKNKIEGKYEYYKTAYMTWKNNLYRAGFEPVQEEGLCWAPFGRTSNSSLIPLFTKLERLLGLHRVTAFSPWVAVIARKGAAKHNDGSAIDSSHAGVCSLPVIPEIMALVWHDKAGLGA